MEEEKEVEEEWKEEEAMIGLELMENQASDELVCVGGER